MRVATIILGTVGLAGLSAFTSVGCSSSSSPTTASAGSGSSSGTVTTTTSTSTGSGSGTSTSGSSGCPAQTGTPGTGSPYPCSPASSCVSEDQSCIGLVDNTGKDDFGLRISYLSITTPSALATGIVATVVENAVEADNMNCNLTGTGDFTWIMEFNTTNNTLKTGGAAPTACPQAGYAFENDSLMSNGVAVPIAPITLSTTIAADGTFSVATGADVNVPIYLNSTAPLSYVILPLNQAKLTMGTLSANHNCIGSYNAKGLQTADNCIASGTTPTFITGGSITGFITLENADNVIVTTLSESLCYFLSGETSGPKNASGDTLCQRDDAGQITYKPSASDGGWCSTSNSAATASCDDSVLLQADFAASSVLITN